MIQPSELSGYVPLLTELGDLKRVRTATTRYSLAGESFCRSWRLLAAGSSPPGICDRETAAALTAARLGGIDRQVLSAGGLSEEEAVVVLRRGFDTVADPLDQPSRQRLRRAVGEPPAEEAPELRFAAALAHQPRAGATRPGRPRLVLEPPESHADHCAAVAVYGAVLSGHFGADPAPVFLCGLAHHLHNALLPDAGFAGEELLGAHLEPVVHELRQRTLSELPDGLRRDVSEALGLVEHAQSPEARAFHAADVLDRVLQMHHYERQAGFAVEQALGEMELVHAGPLKGFQDRVLGEAGLG